MHRPPPIRSVRYYPAAGGTCLAAIAVTVASMSGVDIDPLVMTSQWSTEPWRLVASALPHVGVLHLAFNVYWTWTFGSLLEQRFGSGRTLLIFLLLAAGSSAAEFAWSSGGVSLSGVGYGLFGFLWVMSRRAPGFADAVDRRTIQLFVGWFFLCIFLTVQNIMPIGNVAHGAGAAIGALLALVLVARLWHRQAAMAGLVVLLAACALGASVGRPYVNHSPEMCYELWEQGNAAWERGDYAEAARLYRKALACRGTDASMRRALTAMVEVAETMAGATEPELSEDGAGERETGADADDAGEVLP